jgi:isopenicillin N synthase-like dioxygenase
MEIETGTPPVIDITPLSPAGGGTGSGPRAEHDCVDAIHAACVDIGFFIVVGHGLDERLRAVLAVSREFFALPQPEKERVPRIDRYGFVPHAGSAIDTGRASDSTEFMDVGLGDEFPLPALAGFTEAVRLYQSAALEVAQRILRALALALTADADFFASRMADPQCRLRLLHYPETSLGADGARPVLNTPHTDYGAITLLATDGVAGLEVKPVDGVWTPVRAPVGSLIVNLGDMLARWTNDRYRSTPHRVLGSPDRDRYSIPFFVNPDPATVVECIPGCVSPENPCRYEPVTAGDFLASRIDSRAEPYVDPREGPARRE